mgnify:CR=1 FL=1
MTAAGLVGILFLADLVAGFPFQRVSVGADVGFVVGSLILSYLSWTVLERARA